MTFTVLFALCLLLPGCAMGITSGAVNHNPVPGPTIKVLSINLCASYKTSRKDRADQLIKFCQSEGVDIILAQEGTTGLFQFDTIKYIANGLGYSYSQVPAFGVPGIYGSNVGVISRYPISDSKPVGCQVSGGDWIDKVPFPGSARGILVASGGLKLMSSHLTVPVEQAEREKQVRCLVNALPTGTTILGGDFNFSRSNPAYPLIRLQEALYSGPPQVDMIFYRGLSLLESRLVFEGRIISDHLGVLATFGR